MFNARLLAGEGTMCKGDQSKRHMRVLKFFLFAVLLIVVQSCAGVDPAKVDVELPKTSPKVKITSYTKALRNLGLMTEIYNTPTVRIMMNPIGDETGASGSTGAEIPRDISEMVKSALNSIGGRVVYVPYDPAFIQNNIVTGYSQFEGKVIPDVVITGGITEFDRGLMTRGKNTDVGVEGSVGLPGNLSKHMSNTVGFDYGSGGKSGLARITLDFNMVNFKTMTGIPLMNATNTMEVSKAISEKNLGITLLGASFGRRGSIKKVQGRHDAVRLLVELSVIQMVGKYLKIPYWKLLDGDAQPDDIVLSEIKKEFYSMRQVDQVKRVQEFLFLMGHDLSVDGIFGETTKAAIKEKVPYFSENSAVIDAQTYLTLYKSVPVNEEILGRRERLVHLKAQTGGAYSFRTPTRQKSSRKNAATQGPSPAVQQTAPKTTDRNITKEPSSSKSTPGIGRILKDGEW